MRGIDILRRLHTPTPSGAAVVFDPGDLGVHIALSNVNTRATKDTDTFFASAVGKHGKMSGKWRFQIKVITGGALNIGVAGYRFLRPVIGNGTSYLGATDQSIAYINDARVLTGGGASQYACATYTTGDVIDVFVDATNKKVWFAKNGAIQNGDPVAGTGGTTLTNLDRAIFPAVDMSGAGTVIDAAGAFISTYAADTTYLPWTTAVSVTKANFRKVGLYIRSLGNFSQAFAEIGVSAASLGTNLLLSGTCSSDMALTAGSLAAAVDGNSTTFWAGGNTGSGNQAPGFFWVDAGVGATLAANFFRVQGRDGGGGGELQAPTLFDLFLSANSTDFDKLATGQTFATFAATTPGTIREQAI